MKVIKKINNNVAVGLDNNNNELIAFGKGIGFQKVPYELTDISKIERTYYGVNHSYIGLVNEIPEDIFDISAKIVEWAKTKLSKELSVNIVFTLADHINFAIKRYKDKMNVKMPLGYEIEHLYETEMMIGKKAVSYINRRKKIKLGKSEAVGIAMHFINAENQYTKDSEKTMDDDQIIEKITELIEQKLKRKINKKNFNYARFVSHMQYLLKRRQAQSTLNSDNDKMFVLLKDEYPETYDCVLEIRDYLKEYLNWSLNNEELLYLMLHVNRLYSREDCNR